MNKPDQRTLKTSSDADSMERPDIEMIAHHVWHLKRSLSNIFNVYLIEDVLVDAATRWNAPSLLKQLRDVPLSSVALTHCHPDHQGAVKRICETRGIPLACPAADVASMEGRAPMQPRTVAAQLVGLAFSGPAYPVQQVLHDGDEIGGFRVVSTPGHTPGHVIYYRESDRVAIVGDVLNNMNLLTGKVGLHEPPAAFTFDREENRRSIRKLVQLRPSLVCFGHGPVLRDMEQLDRFIANLPA